MESEMTQEAKQEFTVFCNDSAGEESFFCSSSRSREEDQPLEGLIAFASQYKGYSGGTHTPVAWSLGYDPNARAESIAAGRLIEREGDRYVARGVESKQQFEIGKVYRNQNGEVVQLKPILRS